MGRGPAERAPAAGTPEARSSKKRLTSPSPGRPEAGKESLPDSSTTRDEIPTNSVCRAISSRPYGLPPYLTYLRYLADPVCKLSTFNYKFEASIGSLQDK